MVKRAFAAALALAACWLLGVAAVALGLGPDKVRLSARTIPVEQRSGLHGDSGSPFSERQDAGLFKTPPSSLRPMDALELVRYQAAILRPAVLALTEPPLAAARARAWAKAVQAAGGSPDLALGELLPPELWFQARLVSARDEPEVRADAKVDNAYGRSYAAIRDALPGTRASAPALEAALEALWAASELAPSLERGPVSPLTKKDRWVPPEKALAASHRYALDVFFTSLSRKGRDETGPTVRSMTSGIVVATSGDWNGGDKPSLYVSGGLSPKAGNGVIVYDPAERRYYAYFHLSDVVVAAGQFVAAGQSLGRGGNTGVNARKPGHGGHLHVEIHDASEGPWRSNRLRDTILSIH